MAGKSKKQKLAAPSTKRTLAQSTSVSTASPILKSAFSPSWSKLSLFSSVLRGLDAHRLRCHDIGSGRLQCEHIFEKSVEINSLSWGSLTEGDSDRKKKKRKRASGADALVNDDEDVQQNAGEVVVAATGSNGKVYLYSPVQAEIIKTLDGGHVGPVTDFQFIGSGKGVRAWSCGGNKLVEWDVKKGSSIRNIAFGETINFFKTLPLPDAIVCASYSTYIVDINSPPSDLTSTFTSHTSQVHTLCKTLNQNKFLSAADGDRFIYVSDIKKEKSLGSLVAKSDVTRIDTAAQDTALVAVTADGVVEVFQQPWSFSSDSETDEESSLKRRKAMTKTSEARIKIVRPDNSQTVKVIDACFSGDCVVVAWVENATSVLFEKVKCLNVDGTLNVSGDVVITKAKTVGIGGAASGRSDANDIKDLSNVNLKQSHTVVIEGADTQDIGMVDAPGDLGEEEEEPAKDSEDDQEDNANDPEEQTFEDRIKALNLSAGGSAGSTEKSQRSDVSPMTNITVPSIDGAAIIANNYQAVKFPNATSLTTVLTQALKTDDRALLETCLQVTKADMIESTIQRLDSLLAADLVMKLSEIIARKPGRAGSLMIWIQKTLVNHGGHLLTLPDLVRTMASLQRVLGKRAEALPKMLALRGRLSMLVAQMKLRSMARDRLGAGGDSAVVYVEGVNRDDESSSDEDEDEVIGDVEESEEEDDSEGGVNGVLDSASEGEEDEEDSDDDIDGPGMYLDREAEETGDDDSDEEGDLDGFVVDDDEVDYDSQDDGFLEDGSEEEAPKVAKKAKGKVTKGPKLSRR
ncbi:Small subunit (SSU) processome component [Orbilia blumenaviensis]|uniref:Small subunit (SSU) processome component n=1 Tax=Orbilia blumenaviensis TaxID=1796055 RepID=A0AAV9VG14_9PEZI